MPVPRPTAPPHERLEAWKACHELSLVVHRSTARWPASERYGLTLQIRRAAISAAANLVEGTARTGGREMKRFTEIARGSLAETEYLLTLAHDLGLIRKEEYTLLHEFVARAGMLVGGLHRALRRRVAPS
jgi:four helix bundle protein